MLRKIQRGFLLCSINVQTTVRSYDDFFDPLIRSVQMQITFSLQVSSFTRYCWHLGRVKAMNNVICIITFFSKQLLCTHIYQSIREVGYEETFFLFWKSLVISRTFCSINYNLVVIHFLHRFVANEIDFFRWDNANKNYLIALHFSTFFNIFLKF